MYQYKYVSTELKGSVVDVCRVHREIIDKKAQEGWRYAGFVPTEFFGDRIRTVDLIFEREISGAT